MSAPKNDPPRHVGGNIGDSPDEQAKEKALQEKLASDAREQAAKDRIAYVEDVQKRREAGTKDQTEVPRRRRS